MGKTTSMHVEPPHHRPQIRKAGPADLTDLEQLDRHIAPPVLRESIEHGRVLVAHSGREFDGEIIGWLRWNLFWDETPFMNMLFVVEPWRGQGIGSCLITKWEKDAKLQGHKRVLTSTRFDEAAQHFYRKHGWIDSGALILPDEPTELLLRKELMNARRPHSPGPIS